MTTFATRTGAELQNIFCRANDRFVVLHNQDSVSGSTQIAEKVEEAVGIAGVEADAGLIEDE
jgi:hypothetical protein